MSAWEAIKDAYTGAFALLQRAAETLQSYWPFILIVAIACIIAGLLAREWKHPAEDEPRTGPLPVAPALLTDGEMELLADLRGHPDAALVRGEVLESEEQA